MFLLGSLPALVSGHSAQGMLSCLEARGFADAPYLSAEGIQQAQTESCWGSSAAECWEQLVTPRTTH